VTTPTPPAPEQAGATVHDQQVDARLSGIERSLAELGARLHPGAQAHTEARLDRPQMVADQVDAALRQADETRRRAEADAQTKTTIDGLAAEVKKLRETPPAQAVRPLTALMWGGRSS